MSAIHSGPMLITIVRLSRSPRSPRIHDCPFADVRLREQHCIQVFKEQNPLHMGLTVPDLRMSSSVMLQSCNCVYASPESGYSPDDVPSVVEF
jgi:hypothetical protein